MYLLDLRKAIGSSDAKATVRELWDLDHGELLIK